MHLSVHRHRLYGLSIESPFPLPGAPIVSAFHGPPDITVLWKSETAWNAGDWRITLASPNHVHPEIGEGSDGSVCLAWSDLRFVINPGRNRILVISRIAKLEFAPTVLVGLVLGVLLHLRGVLCLHGSVLERAGSAIALLGESGAGKSTVAAALVQRGAHLLSDDMVVIVPTQNGFSVEPGCAGMRIDPAVAKRLLDLDTGLATVPYLRKLLWDFSGELDAPDERFCPKATSLDTLYFLETGQGHDIAVGPALSPPEALRRILASWYPPGLWRLLTQERLCTFRPLAEKVPLRVIRHTKKWDQLPRLLEVLGA